MILDQSKDALGVELYRLARLYEAPAYVKSASEEQLKGTPDMARHGYADQVNRRFPMHTAAATWTSAAHAFAKAAELPAGRGVEIVAALEKAAGYWGIAGDIRKLAAAIARDRTFADDSLSDDDFALVEEFDAGRSRERHMRLLNPNEVKVAAQWFGRYRDDFTYEDRRTVARKILAKAASVGADLPEADSEMLERTAGFGSCATRHAVELVRGRSLALVGRDEKLAHDLRAIADDLGAGKVKVRDPEMLDKIAALVDKCDRVTGLSRSYITGDVPRPEDVLFRVTEKVASDFVAAHLASSSGSVYRRDALSRLTPSQVRDHMGDGFADAVMDGDGLWVDTDKLAAILPTMPRDDAESFDRLAASAGAAVVQKRAADPSGRPSLAELAAIMVG